METGQTHQLPARLGRERTLWIQPSRQQTGARFSRAENRLQFARKRFTVKLRRFKPLRLSKAQLNDCWHLTF